MHEIVTQPDQLAELAALRGADARDRGRAGRHVPEADATTSSPRCRARELVVMPDAGHSPQFENPAVWIAAMLEFLDSL